MIKRTDNRTREERIQEMLKAEPELGPLFELLYGDDAQRAGKSQIEPEAAQFMFHYQRDRAELLRIIADFDKIRQRKEEERRQGWISLPKHVPKDKKNVTRGEKMSRDLNEQLDDFDRYLNEPAPEEVPDEPVLVQARDASDARQEWIWPGRIPVGDLTLIAGEPGAGCSLVAVDLASRVTKGSRNRGTGGWGLGAGDGLRPETASGAESNPQSAIRNPQSAIANVLFVDGQDQPRGNLRTRLAAAGADLDRVTLLTEVMKSVDGQRRAVPVVANRDLELIEQAVAKVPDCRLVVVDRLTLAVDRHGGGLVAATALRRLRELARKHGVAVVAIVRMEGCGLCQSPELALRRGLTTLAAEDDVRGLWAVIRDRHEPSRRLLLPWKNVWGESEQGFAFRFEEGTGDRGVGDLLGARDESSEQGSGFRVQDGADESSRFQVPSSRLAASFGCGAEPRPNPQSAIRNPQWGNPQSPRLAWDDEPVSAMLLRGTMAERARMDDAALVRRLLATGPIASTELAELLAAHGMSLFRARRVSRLARVLVRPDRESGAWHWGLEEHYESQTGWWSELQGVRSEVVDGEGAGDSGRGAGDGLREEGASGIESNPQSEIRDPQSVASPQRSGDEQVRRAVCDLGQGAGDCGKPTDEGGTRGAMQSPNGGPTAIDHGPNGLSP